MRNDADLDVQFKHTPISHVKEVESRFRVQEFRVHSPIAIDRIQVV